jgi:hypothetical protein
MKKTKKSIIFAEFHPWSSPLKVGGHRYAEQFAKDGWQVMWLANFLNLNRVIRRSEYDLMYLQNWKRGSVLVSNNVHTYTPFCYLPYIDFPILSSVFVARNSLRCCLPQLKSALKHPEFDSVDVLWVSQPRMYSLVNIVDHQVLVYRMFDDVQHFQGEPDSIQKVERLLCEQADVVFATSQPLVRKAERWSDRVVYLPNGADVERFCKSNPSEPEDLKEIPYPRILYVGAIAYWFDFELILHAARKRPNWSFVLVGPCGVEDRKDQLKELPNVYFLGQRDPGMVPAYMRYADIGLIPFKVNPLTHSVSPIKLFEYSMAGLPVVASHLREVKGYNSPTLFYADVREFLGAVEKGLSMQDDLRSRFIEFGLANSWKARYRIICDTLSTI